MTSHTHHIAFKLALLAGLLVSSPAFAAEQTYVREYTYQASEADSKISARTIALQEVKRELLNELGTHITALVKIQSASDGTQLGKEEIETLSAGVTRVEILEEKWNGVVYVLKAQIKADPEEVLKNLHKMLDADKKQKQISQLGGELSKIQTEKIQIAESLTRSRRETDAALAEIARLKKQLQEKQTDASRQTLQAEYKDQVDQLELNELFESGLRFFRVGSFSESLGIFRKAAEQGHAEAQIFLGLIYVNGARVTRDAKQGVYWIQKAAEQGNADAQIFLGLMYAEGRGVTRDTKQAVFWYQKAADQGAAQAQFILGWMYDKGEGVSQSATQGFHPLNENMHANSEGVTRDAKQAVYWYKKAATQGLATAQYNLGLMYANGEGVSRDAKQAMYWVRKAAEQGDADAQFTLGWMYEKGEGVTRDFKQAVYWYRKAAEQGDANAQFSFSGMYYKGEGVARDENQALYWAQKAAEQGHVGARRVLPKLQKLQGQTE